LPSQGVQQHDQLGGGDLVSPNAMTDVFVADFTTNGAYRWQRSLGVRRRVKVRAALPWTARATSSSLVATLKPSISDAAHSLRSVVPTGSWPSAPRRTVRIMGRAAWRNRKRLRECGCSRQRRQRTGGGRVPGDRKPGRCVGVVVGQDDGVRLKYSNAGARIWVRTYGGSSADWFNACGDAGTSANPVLGGYFYGTATFGARA
jgi:hypothetical protein